MRTARRPVALAVTAVSVLLTLALAAPARAGAFRIDFVGEGRADDVETMEAQGTTYFRLADLSRAFLGTRHWNPLTGKVTLVVNGHRISASEGNQFARCDDEIRNVLRPPLRAEDGLWVPPAYLTDALAWAVDSSIAWDRTTGTVTVIRHWPLVTSATVEGVPGGTVLVLGLSEQAQFSTDDSAGDAVDVLVRGAGLSDSLVVPDGTGLITGLTVDRARRGVLVTAHLADDAGGYGASLRSDPDRIEILVEQGVKGSSRAARAAAPSAPEETHGVERVMDTVVIDPGHGGPDPGAVGLLGLPEKDVTLAIARGLEQALEKEGFHVLLTRAGDEALPIKRRAEIANLAEADLFLSIHVNGWHASTARGAQVSYRAPVPLSLARGSALQRSRFGGTTTQWQHAQDPFVPASRDLARAVHDRVAAAMPLASRGSRGNDLAMLSGCTMPAVMVEVGFATNGDDASALASQTWRRDLARAIARGVSDFRASMRGRRL